LAESFLYGAYARLVFVRIYIFLVRGRDVAALDTSIAMSVSWDPTRHVCNIELIRL